MQTQSDPLHPQNFLEPGETLLWSGRPNPNPPPGGALKFIRLVGYVLLACFALFAVLGWVNRADLDGAGGILTGFLVISLFGAAFLIWGLPLLTHRALAQTHYGVTNTRAMIVHGLGGPRISMLRVRAEAQIDASPIGRGLHDVIFGTETDMLYTPHIPSLDATQRTPIQRLLKFQALSDAEAQAAKTALDHIKGAAGDGPVHEWREV